MTFAVQCSALYSNYLCAMILYVSTYLLKRKLLFLLFLNDYVWIEKFWNNVKFFFQIPRYIITLHELLAHTPPDHVEKKSLENARKQLEDLSRQMHDEVIYSRPVASGGAGGGMCPPPLFGRSVNPISTRGGTFSPPSITCPPRFSDLATALCMYLCFRN